MPIPSSEAVRVFLSNYLFCFLDGMKLTDWLRLLRDNNFAVDPPFWPRAFFITTASICNSIAGAIEDGLYGSGFRHATHINPPLFILGHWRNGTTFLHQLLAADSQFAFPNLYQVSNPHTFLLSEGAVCLLLDALVPRRRLQDNVSLGFRMPMEEEFALAVATSASPYTGWVFSRHYEMYEGYLTLKDVPEAQVRRWKEALVALIRKLSWKYGRALLLKSPPHTCRIRLLLEMFPDARFVHIHRNPYAVFQSMMHLRRSASPYFNLQRPDLRRLERQVIRCYRKMYDVFFEERALIPDGHFHEVAFEELEEDPLGQLALIYDKLNLQAFDEAAPALRAYLDSLGCYRKNEYPDPPSAQREQIGSAWQRCFQEWGYSLT
jgi:hypothetical protein